MTQNKKTKYISVVDFTAHQAPVVPVKMRPTGGQCRAWPKGPARVEEYPFVSHSIRPWSDKLCKK